MSNRKVFLQGVSSGILVKVGTALLSIVMVPFYINYFGNSSYGSYIVLTTVFALATLINLGVPSAISIIGAQSHTTIKVTHLFQTTFLKYIIYLVSISIILVVLLSVYQDYVFDELLKLTFDIHNVYVIVLIVFASAFSAYVQSLFFALHKLHISNIIMGVTSLQFPLAFFITYFLHKDIEFFLEVASIVTFLTPTLFLILYFKYYKSSLNEAIVISEHSDRNILITSFTALAINIISLTINNIDILIISYYLPKELLVKYSILLKIIAVQMMFVGVFLNTLTPFIGKWYRENNFEAIGKLYRISIISSSILGGIIILGNTLFMESIITLWVGSEQYVGTYYVILYSFFLYLFCIYSINYIVFSSFNINRKLTLKIAIIEPVIKIILSIYLTKTYGLEGTIFSVVFLALFVTFPLTTYMLKFFSQNKISIDFSYTFKNFALVLLPFTFLSYFTKELEVVFQIFVGLLILSAFIYISWKMLHNDERVAIKNLIRRKYVE